MPGCHKVVLALLQLLLVPTGRSGDGVSESQFTQVQNLEVDRVIKNMGQGQPPKITVTVAQKNHHTELFQADAPDNVPPGKQLSYVKHSGVLSIPTKEKRTIYGTKLCFGSEHFKLL
uniref:Piwi domain-containing protein n=2 Tax=Aegilops tauschii subsp. strangulata TaxID=200361 RepID=A0A453BF64_AEGTS